MKRKISFPHLGNYHIPITFFIEKITKEEVLSPPPISKKTLELGSKYAPDSVCIPFKYNLGNFIESLENGATTILQAGGGCRYGYYSEVQEKILKDLGYHFEFINLMEPGKLKIRKVMKELKKINPSLHYYQLFYYGILSFLMIKKMDDSDEYIRKNIGFEKVIGSFEKIKKEMLESFSKTKGFFNLLKTSKYYSNKLKEVEVDKPEDCLKVGIIGELYTSMEPFSSYFLEKELAKMNFEIKRFTNATYLLFLKKRKEKKLLRTIEEYCTYTIGADGMDNVARAKWLVNEGYDGIIHIKPFGCTPEIGAIPILQRLSEQHEIPMIFFSFDSETSEVGIKTRLEAFYDMLYMKKGGKPWKDI